MPNKCSEIGFWSPVRCPVFFMSCKMSCIFFGRCWHRWPTYPVNCGSWFSCSVAERTEETGRRAEGRRDVPGPPSLLRSARDRPRPQVHTADVQDWHPRYSVVDYYSQTHHIHTHTFNCPVSFDESSASKVFTSKALWAEEISTVPLRWGPCFTLLTYCNDEHHQPWFSETTTVLRPLSSSTCISRHLQLRTGGFCWSKF